MPDTITQSIHQRSYIAVPIEKVYDTMSSGDGWNAFFTHNTEMHPEIGSTCVWRWKDWGPDLVTLEASGTVLEARRPNRFVFTWGSEQLTTIEFDLTQLGSGTVVDIKHHGFHDTDHGLWSILDCACGWGEAVTLLKFYLEHGIVYTPVEKS